MDDLRWERAQDFIQVSLEDIRAPLAGFDKSLVPRALEEINIGCRNTNYRLRTNRGDFHLRIAIDSSAAERKAAELLYGLISMPRLYFAGIIKDKPFYLYQYIEGISLQAHIAMSGCGADIAEQAALSAAALHSLDRNAIADMERFVPPPFETWYELFLENGHARAALGPELIARIQAVLNARRGDISRIGAMDAVPIHADFRPANMLLDASGKVYIVDWEGFGEGHALGDIGQFFRFRKYFPQRCFDAFEDAYNGRAPRKLPGGWSRLMLLRDLVNPLQMLGRDWNAPNARADLLAVVRQTVDFFQDVQA